MRGREQRAAGPGSKAGVPQSKTSSPLALRTALSLWASRWSTGAGRLLLGPGNYPLPHGSNPAGRRSSPGCTRTQCAPCPRCLPPPTSPRAPIPRATDLQQWSGALGSRPARSPWLGTVPPPLNQPSRPTTAPSPRPFYLKPCPAVVPPEAGSPTRPGN